MKVQPMVTEQVVVPEVIALVKPNESVHQQWAANSTRVNKTSSIKRVSNCAWKIPIESRRSHGVHQRFVEVRNLDVQGQYVVDIQDSRDSFASVLLSNPLFKKNHRLAG
jgi:hypothetical protein